MRNAIQALSFSEFQEIKLLSFKSVSLEIGIHAKVWAAWSTIYVLKILVGIVSQSQVFWTIPKMGYTGRKNELIIG